MKLGWNEKNLFDDRDTLKKLAENESNIHKKLYICKVLDCINHNCELNYTSLLQEKDKISDLLQNTTLAFYAYGRYHSLIEEFYFGLKHYHQVMETISIKLGHILKKEENFTNLVQCKVSDEEAISLVRGFYSNFDEELSSIVNKIYDSDNFHLNFSEHKKKKNGIESDGSCIFIDILKHYYVSIDKSIGVTKAYNLIHETGHAVDYYLNPTSTYDETTRLSCEIASIFPEMVALFENHGGFNNIISSHELYSLLTTYYEHSNAILFHKIIVNIFKKHNYKTNLAFYLELKAEYGLKQKDIYRFLSHDVALSGSYILSFEACCELLYIYFYENNKDKAINIYKKIISGVQTKDELEVLFEEIPLGEHLVFIARKILMRMIDSVKEYEKNENMGLRLSK